MSKIKWVSAAVIASSCAFATQAALAYNAGDIFVRGGFAESNLSSGDEANLDDANGFTYGAGYLFSDKVGLELNSSEKMHHDVSGAGIEGIDRQPINLMVNYYPLGGLDSRVQPYVGAGLNYTRFSGEPSGVDARRSYGAAGQVGIDLAITDNVMLNGFANYADVDARFNEGGESIGAAEIDPLTVGGGITFRF